ncbi:MAG: TIGR02147 family protein [Fibrobacter sp.]|nr:TIGR02147 family protein [Fibrobacter sp.]
MKPVMEYNNFRIFVRDYYAERKDRSGFTWRDFAKAAGYSSPVFLKLVCDGKANLSEAGVERVASAIGLVGVDLQYFRLLVSFNQEKDSAAKKQAFAEMRKLAKDNETAVVGEDQYDYYESWLNPVIREVAPLMNGATPAKMAEQVMFDADTAKVKKSLKLLQKTGLLEKGEQGEFKQGNKSITTGSLEVASLAIREMHRQMGELAVQSLDQVPVDERDISGLTIGISEDAFAKIAKEIADFRRRVSSIVMEDSGNERVYRLNVQLFPLTKQVAAAEGGEYAE